MVLFLFQLILFWLLKKKCYYLILEIKNIFLNFQEFQFIVKVLKIGDRTIDRITKKFIEEGFESVLERRPSCQNYTKKMDGDLEAKLVTLCCSDPPEGYSQWSLRLLADKLVELNYIDNVDDWLKYY